MPDRLGSAIFIYGNNGCSYLRRGYISKIYVVRDQKVILDEDLAELYGVETRVLNQAVARNIIRFPSDFMFKLSEEEFNDLKSQTVTS